MKFGVTTFVTDYTLPVTELAQRVEAAGLESLWVSEHTHQPVHTSSPWPATASEAARRATAYSFDPFVALGAAAAVTKELRLGTGICLVTERDPIVTAKAVATLDQISAGRFEFGIGAGWNREELAHHGTRFADRFAVLAERVAAIRTIWASDEAEFEGQHVAFDALRSWPKPVQSPHPPILLGGNAGRILERVVALGDGWLPIFRTVSDLRQQVETLGRLAEGASRERPTVSVTNAPVDRLELVQLAELGVERAIFRIPAADADEALPRLQEISRAVAAYHSTI